MKIEFSDPIVEMYRGGYYEELKSFYLPQHKFSVKFKIDKPIFVFYPKMSEQEMKLKKVVLKILKPIAHYFSFELVSYEDIKDQDKTFNYVNKYSAPDRVEFLTRQEAWDDVFPQEEFDTFIEYLKG